MSGDEPEEPLWDEVVDVLYVGAGPGVLAHAIAAAESDADLLMIGEARQCDQATSDYLGAMTEDLDLDRPASLELPVLGAEPVAVPAGRRGRIEPFVGPRLREFSAGCAASVFGLLHTEPEVGGTVVRSGGEILHATEIGAFRRTGDRPGPALIDWLGRRADDLDLRLEDETVLLHLVFDGLRVAGAAVEGPSGTRLIGASAGVVLGAKAVPDGCHWPAGPDVGDHGLRVAVVRHTAGRFGRVVLLRQPD